MSFSDNKQFWTEFITLYREQRALWDVRSKEYSNKHIKRDCYVILIEKCKDITPDANEKFVKAKIESLRASFRRELKKVLKSKNKTGSSQDDLYEPHLWYFDLLLFTSDHETVRKGVSSLGKRSIQSEEEERNLDEQVSEEENDINSEGPDTNNVNQESTTHTIGNLEILERPECGTSRSQQKSETPRMNRPFRTPPEAPQSSSSSSRRRRNKNETTGIEKKKECFLDIATQIMSENTSNKAFGNNVAFQLEGLDRTQRIFAEKIISDALFYAKLGKLTETSSISTGLMNTHDTSSNFIRHSHFPFPQNHPSQQFTMAQSFNSPHSNYQAYVNHSSTQYPTYLTLQNVPRTESQLPSSGFLTSSTSTVSTPCSLFENSSNNSAQDPIGTYVQDENATDEMTEFLSFENQRSTTPQQ